MTEISLRQAARFDLPDEKRRYNRALFREVAPRYDLVTRLLSFGRDASWKRWLVGALPQQDRRHILDLACGTGDLTRLLADRYPDAEVIGLDLTPEMLALARGLGPSKPEYLEGDMAQTELADASQDLITGGYALRNAPDLDRAFAEIVRLLRPGGHAAFLDFSISPHPVARALTLGLLRFWGGLWGFVLHGNPRVYAYIADSLAAYPDRLALRQQAARHGLGVLRSRAFFFGMLEVIVFAR